MAQIFVQDPDAMLDYVIDWTAYLNGDTLLTSAWVAPGLTTSSPSNTSNTATVFLSGGTPGITYKVRNRITTALGRKDDETFDVIVRDH